MKYYFLSILTFFVLTLQGDPETADFLDNWFPLGIPESTIKDVLEQDDVPYTRSVDQGTPVVDATIDNQRYIYFMNEDGICYLLVKEYPINQLSERLKRFDSWTQIDVDYLKWQTDSFYIYRVFATMEIKEDKFSILYWTE